MATIKSYSDLQQSKKLAEILLVESTDMWWNIELDDDNEIDGYSDTPSFYPASLSDIPCWSLAALLSVLPKVINNETLFIETSPVLWHIGYRNIYTARADNPIDACVAMIEKLHELKML